MKIEIDLNDILHDGYDNPTESMAESIRRQVVEHITAKTRDDVKRQISEEVAAVLNAELAKAVAEQMPSIVSNLMAHPYQPVGRYGERGQETNFRKELLKSITEQMVYKKQTYDSDKNAFTRAVDQTVSAHLETFRKEFTKQVDGAFIAQAMAFATERLRERLGVPKQ